MGATLHDPEEKRPRRVEDLIAQFKESISSVQHYGGSLEEVSQKYIQPVALFALESLQEKPIRTVFFTCFSVVASLPLVTYAVSSILAVIAYVAFALLGAAAASAATVIGFTFILIPTLIALAGVAAACTIFIISIFFLLRLAFLAQQRGRSDGFYAWLTEVKVFVLEQTVPCVGCFVSMTKDGHSPSSHSCPSEKSEGSLVLVGTDSSTPESTPSADQKETLMS
ncbi:hypothetical protein CC1G_15578 [Coprinopsis cinerea okayama7|uniref:Transmembrane protein n=1 Tax=Coprinopsis cinerea (strain Okayama-7 / 130 / ATCC MYA-4618 / FGSC 9003) TaxID=240176 RepID=D6RNB9_COPC7|nr:hypothetical protein CC1G_15578 [Coprinopsis cinerea okayama7\|eukprot:XP_002911035.1 hypothetical protein CC1G_15578 [Coprinopsis cinerea okayama7\